MNRKYVPVHTNVQWHQSFWNISYVHAQIAVAAQSIVHAVRTICIAQSCAHVIAMTFPHSIGDQDVLYDYDGDDDDKDSE